MGWMKGTGLVAAALTVLAGGLMAYGSWRWQAATAVLLPSQGVRWEAVDDTSAHTTLADGWLTLKLFLRFNAEGLIDTVRAKARGRRVDGTTVSAPWQGHCWRYALQDGMRVPQEGDAAWMLPEGEKPYWRGSTVSASFELAPPCVRQTKQKGS